MPNTIKLTQSDRKSIAEMYKAGRGEKSSRGKYTLAEIAKKHNIGITCAHYVATGQR